MGAKPYQDEIGKQMLKLMHSERKLEREKMRIWHRWMDAGYKAIEHGRIGEINQAIDVLDERR